MKIGDARRIRTAISSSGGISLNFLDTDMDILDEYEEQLLKLQLATYRKLRKRNGIYASNQHKYVASPYELNGLDSQRMERLNGTFPNDHHPTGFRRIKS